MATHIDDFERQEGLSSKDMCARWSPVALTVLGFLQVASAVYLPRDDASAVPRLNTPGLYVPLARHIPQKRDPSDVASWLKSSKLALEAKYGLGGDVSGGVEKRANGSNPYDILCN